MPGSLAQHLHEIGLGRRPMPSHSDAKRQHFIPKLLLREFRDPALKGERLWQLDKRTGACHPISVKSAASREHLYQVSDEQGEISDKIEAILGLVETHAAQSLRQLREDPLVLDSGDRCNVAFYLALQDLRTPSGHERARLQLSIAARLQAALLYENPAEHAARSRRLDRRPTAAEIEHERRTTLKELREGSLVVEAAKEHAFGMMFNVWLGMSELIADLGWQLLDTTDGDFVIGDRPLTLHDPTPRFPWSGNGLKSSPHAYGFMPLSATTCLRMDQSPRGTACRKASRDYLVARANLASYGWAERYLFGRDPETLRQLHQKAQNDPGAVPEPRPDPVVLTEEADPNDPTVGAEHPPGYPRGLWYHNEDGSDTYMNYELLYADDSRTPVLFADEAA